MEQMVEDISQRFPCRSKFIRQLYRYYGTGDTFPPALYVYGQTSTGKLSIVKEVLHGLAETRHQWRYVVLNAVGCYTKKLLFETIAVALHGYKRSPENNYRYHKKLEYAKDFLADLRELDPNGSYVIAVQYPERLREMADHIFPMMLQLPEMTGLNISVLLISSQPFEKYFNKTGLPPVIKLFVPKYTREEMRCILMNDFTEIKWNITIESINMHSSTDDPKEKQRMLGVAASMSKDFFENYVNLFLGTFWKVCRDVKELRPVAKDCFKPYIAPVLEGKIAENDSVRLWRNITGVLKMALRTVFMRVDTTGYATDPAWLARNLELPYYGKYLLIAAYLASHNAPKEDKRLFMKHHGKQKKRLQTINARAVVSEKMSTQLAPKTFNVDRLMAIFYSIIDEKVGLTCNMLAQISTLVHLKCLAYATNEAGLLDGSCRLQCTVGLEFILQIGRMIGFNVRQYLCAFN